MNKTKIEWCDSTWNPVTGCLHGCEYCYARKIANRFSGGGCGKEMGMFISRYSDDAFNPPYDLSEPQLVKTKDDWYRNAPYPFGFEPTFHRYRLKEPANKKNSQNIFVCSMADLFGEWVPDEWIESVFKACKAAPQHTYLFLTKNPERYDELHEKGLLPNKNNYWYGTTVITQKDYDKTGINLFALAPFGYNMFMSVEPIHENITFRMLPDWLIIGAETGNRKNKVIPKKEWVDNIVRKCDNSNIPIFLKDRLLKVIGEENMRREFPFNEVKNK